MNNNQIIFWGTPAFAVPCFSALTEMHLIRAVVTREPKPHGRGRHTIQKTPIHEAALAQNLPILTPAAINDESFKAALQAFLPAMFFVVAYGRIIPADILALSTPRALNLHPSLLPILRGPSPIQTAILEGHTQTGLTLMVLDSEMDHGPIVAQKKITLTPNDTYQTLSEKLSFAAAQFVQKHLPAYLAAGATPATPQDHPRATYSKLITADDGLLNPVAETADVMHRKIRALNPWPGTYVRWKGKRLRVERARIRKDILSGDTTFVLSPQGTLCIRCRNGGILETSTVTLEGGKPMNSQDFVRGHSSIVG